MQVIVARAVAIKALSPAFHAHVLKSTASNIKQTKQHANNACSCSSFLARFLHDPFGDDHSFRSARKRQRPACPKVWTISLTALCSGSPPWNLLTASTSARPRQTNKTQQKRRQRPSSLPPRGSETLSPHSYRLYMLC